MVVERAALVIFLHKRYSVCGKGLCHMRFQARLGNIAVVAESEEGKDNS